MPDESYGGIVLLTEKAHSSYVSALLIEVEDLDLLTKRAHCAP
jgi:hypothetical protein